MAPAMEGGAAKMPDEVRQLTIRQARVAVMSSKDALQMATESIADEIGNFVKDNSKNWAPISELKKLTKEQAEARNREQAEAMNRKQKNGPKSS